MNKNVAVLGASSRPGKYSYRAVDMLSTHGYNVFPVHPSGLEVAGHKTYKSLSEINEKIHTLSIYVNSNISGSMKGEILKLNPERIIFNPGAENPELAKACDSNNIFTENACTLVLLQTNSF